MDRAADRDRRRRAILSLARDVFLAEGYAAASMSSIAARVGGSKATLYNYFPSKEALFTAVVDDQCAHVMASMSAFDAEADDIAVALRRFGEQFTRAILSEEVIALHRLVVAESIRFPEIGDALYEAGPRTGHLRLTAIIGDAMAAGRLRPADPSRAAQQLTDLCLSGLYRHRLWNVPPIPSNQDICDNVEAALAVFLAAYGPTAGAF